MNQLEDQLRVCNENLKKSEIKGEEILENKIKDMTHKLEENKRVYEEILKSKETENNKKKAELEEEIKILKLHFKILTCAVHETGLRSMKSNKPEPALTFNDTQRMERTRQSQYKQI